MYTFFLSLMSKIGSGAKLSPRGANFARFLLLRYLKKDFYSGLGVLRFLSGKCKSKKDNHSLSHVSGSREKQSSN